MSARSYCYEELHTLCLMFKKILKKYKKHLKNCTHCAQYYKRNLLTCSCKWCKVVLQTPVTRQRSQFVVDCLNKKPMIINWKQNKQKEDNSWKIWSTVIWNSIVWYFPFFYLNFYLKHRGLELHCLIFSFLLSFSWFIMIYYDLLLSFIFYD